MIDEIASTTTAQSQTIPFRRVSTKRPVPTELASRLAVHQTTTYRWSLLEDAHGYRLAGIEAIGLWRTKLFDYDDDNTVDVIRDSGLTVSSLSWAGGFTGGNHSSFAEAVEDAKDALRLAGRLEAGCLVLTSGPRAGHTRRHAKRLVAQGIRALADDAAEQNVLLALQPMSTESGSQWSFLSSIDETLEVLDASGVPHARLVFNAHHLGREPRLLERIPEIAPLVATVLLNDHRNSGETEGESSLPGDGELPLQAMTRAFLEADYDGHFEIGAWSDNIWNADYRDVLKSCRERFLALCGT